MAYKATCKTLAKVGDDEPIFVLRAQDELAERTVKFWAALASRNLVSESKIAEAEACALAMSTWKGRKLPD